MAVPTRRLFVDLDGVLADFDKRVIELTGQKPNDFGRAGDMWRQIAPPQCPDFYAELDWMQGGPQLWEAVRGHNPTILTGLPIGKWAEPQKRHWCATRLGAGVPVITCMARDKAQHARAGDVLIDDREDKARAIWEAKGGVFIHHTDAATSIAALRKYFPAPPPASPSVAGPGSVPQAGAGAAAREDGR